MFGRKFTKLAILMKQFNVTIFVTELSRKFADSPTGFRPCF